MTDNPKVHEVPAKFRTSDGREFESKEEAERAQSLTDAIRGFDKAKHALCRATLASLSTADDKPFDVGAEHWYIVNREWPYLIKTQAIFYVDLLIMRSDSDVLIRVNSAGHEWQVYPKELYRDERAAKTALLKLRQAWIAIHQKEGDELEADISRRWPM